MTKKMKVRVSALIMCAAMLVSAISVLAASKTEYVTLDASTTGTAYAYISDSGLYASASTSGQSLYNDILVTSITGYGTSPNSASGHTSATISGVFSSASSYHKWTSRTHTITVYP